MTCLIECKLNVHKIYSCYITEFRAVAEVDRGRATIAVPSPLLPRLPPPPASSPAVTTVPCNEKCFFLNSGSSLQDYKLQACIMHQHQLVRLRLTALSLAPTIAFRMRERERS